MKIVLVDDNSLFVESIHLYLETKGFDVSSFTSPLEALEFCKNSTCDMLVTDLVMDDMDGIELIDEVRKIHPTIRSLLVSGHVDEEDEKQRAVFCRHFDATMSKPLLLEALLFVIQELLDEPMKILPPVDASLQMEHLSQERSTTI